MNLNEFMRCSTDGKKVCDDVLFHGLPQSVFCARQIRSPLTHQQAYLATPAKKNGNCIVILLSSCCTKSLTYTYDECAFFIFLCE